MTESRMYDKRRGNIPVFRGCLFSCSYCSFKRLVKLNKKCPDCAEFKPHFHPEALDRTPPKTKDGEFITIGLSSDISFMDPADFCQVIQYCRKWSDRTFLIQSKNPEYFLQGFGLQESAKIPNNVIIGTTIETNYSCADISAAPNPQKRFEAMLKLDCRKIVTIEPIMDFDLNIMAEGIPKLNPEVVYVGYCNDRYNGKRLKLPEPALAKTEELIERLTLAGINVVRKSIRPAWWEKT